MTIYLRPHQTSQKAQKREDMATRNRRGRNLVSSNPSNKLAFAKYNAIKKAEAKGMKNQLLDYITQCGSVQAVILIENKYSL